MSESGKAPKAPGRGNRERGRDAEDFTVKPNKFDRIAGPGPKDEGKGAIGRDAEERLEHHLPPPGARR